MMVISRKLYRPSQRINSSPGSKISIKFIFYKYFFNFFTVNSFNPANFFLYNIKGEEKKSEHELGSLSRTLVQEMMEVIYVYISSSIIKMSKMGKIF